MARHSIWADKPAGHCWLQPPGLSQSLRSQAIGGDIVDELMLQVVVVDLTTEIQRDVGGVTGEKTIWFSPKNTPMGAVRKAFETIGRSTPIKAGCSTSTRIPFGASHQLHQSDNRALRSCRNR